MILLWQQQLKIVIDDPSKGENYLAKESHSLDMELKIIFILLVLCSSNKTELIGVFLLTSYLIFKRTIYLNSFLA